MDWKNYYQIIPYTDHIFRIASPEGVFIELFVGSHHALLLDTGFGFGDLKGAVRSVTSLPLIVVNTHGHLDHCNGNHLFPGYPVYMNENDWPMYRENFDPQQRKDTLEQAQHKRMDWNSENYANILPEDLDRENYIHAGTRELRPLNEGMVFDLGGITLKTIEVPGHTPGSCALLHEQTSELYIGDAANAHMVLSFSGSMDNYKNTLKKLKALDFKRMRLSHDTDWKEKSVINDFIDCVENADPDNYTLVASLFDPDIKDYMYIRRGYKASDGAKPGFASFIVKSKLGE